MKKVLFSLALVVFGCVSFAAAQPRPVDKNAGVTVTPKVSKPAPATVEAKYQGGLFGYSRKAQGTLKFDDTNLRLVFYGEDQKELFAIPYETMLVVSPNEKKVQSGTGRTVGAAPLPGAGLLGGLMNKKKNYLLVQFRDTDSNAEGTASFLIDTPELLDSVIHTLGEKAEMKQRGDAYYRPRKVDF